MDRLAQQSGKEVVLAIEPEPGCVLHTAPDIVEFFEHYLFSGPDAKVARQYLTVCHDICHSGVMFEPQQEALLSYRQAGIRIGKVQVSSAVHVPWDAAIDLPQRTAMLEQLRTFNEPKYLHQTSRCDPAGRLSELSEDLSHALSNWLPDADFPSQPWRIHFHVPIFVDAFEQLSTTQADIATATRCLEQHRHEQIEGVPWFTGHYEVETYAWTVLPDSLSSENLAEGIAHEMKYFAGILEQGAALAP